MTKIYKSEALAALHETASDLHEIGLQKDQNTSNGVTPQGD
ncbi:hypothetical protein IAD21_00237 [Abditibacteriota bacterium]|nr:hypothetical protein IAD21_00237 [Abditibacteriota bacterium]